MAKPVFIDYEHSSHVFSAICMTNDELTNAMTEQVSLIRYDLALVYSREYKQRNHNKAL